jgi:uncharacterized protein (UPF0548 family)
VPVLLSRPSEAYLSELEGRLGDASFTYSEVGATAGPVPPNYRVERSVAYLGNGPAVWARSQEALRGWQAHRGAGATVHPAGAALAQGTTVIVTMPLWPVYIVAPCRVAYSTDDPRHFGFAYGTLPGHPEQGEESFHVVKDDDGGVRFEIVSFSRPASFITQLGGPFSRSVQRRTTQRYLEGVRAYVATA